MPPRHAYWTIILEGKPTAFRAHTQEELLPTLRQLQSKHPDAVMKWFARGKLWHSPEEERMAAALKRRAGERRPPTWRPGGQHADPRERFKVPRDVKRSRFAAKFRRDRFDREGSPGSGERPADGQPPRPDWTPGERTPKRPPRPDWKPGERPPNRPPRPEWKPGSAPSGGRPQSGGFPRPHGTSGGFDRRPPRPEGGGKPGGHGGPGRSAREGVDRPAGPARPGRPGRPAGQGRPSPPARPGGPGRPGGQGRPGGPGRPGGGSGRPAGPDARPRGRKPRGGGSGGGGRGR